MQDKRHPEDQLFFIAEGDFRFYEEDCVGGFDWIQKLLDLEKEDPLRLDDAYVQKHPAFQGTSSTEAAEPFARSWHSSGGHSQGLRRRRSAFEQTQHEQPSVEGWQPGTRCRMREGHVSQELNDLVRIVTTAARVGHGNLVWLSWCGRNTRKLHPSHGATLIAISRRGAELLQPLIDRGTPDHFDVWLRNVLLHENWADVLGIGASFVVPSVGSYDQHLSGCDPTGAGEGGVRVSTWKEPWTQPGVRPTDRPGQAGERWICRFLKKGGPEYLAKVNFSEERSLCWLTEAPPNKWKNWDNDWWTILESRGWVWHGELCIPEVRNPGGSGRGALRPLAQKWVDVANWPDGFAWEEDVQAWSPISRMAELIVVDFPSYDPLSRQTTDRMKQTRKKQLAIYKRRIFVETENEVAGASFDPSQEASPPYASPMVVSSEVVSEPFAWTHLEVPFATELPDPAELAEPLARNS